MQNVIESKAFPWIVAVAIGALMGFLVGPALTGAVLHETLPLAFRFALALISLGIVGLVIEKALARRVPLLPTAPGHKSGKVDSIFGAGRVTYDVTPGKDGRIQINVTARGIAGRRFRDELLKMLAEIEGIEWGTPTEPSPYVQRQALRRLAERREQKLVGGTVTQPVNLDRCVSGTLTAEASLAKAIEQLEERLGSPQPL